MKFFSFDELTYPGVPEIGPEIRFTNRFCDPKLAHQTYHEHIEEWAACEDLGFDGAFVNEHHFTAFNTQPACNIMATAIIMKTKKMKVGVIGNVIPLRHPIRTAEEFAMMDVLSGGRFVAGIVRGLPQEYVSYNVDPFTSRERLKEGYDIIFRALTQEVFDYDGKFWKMTGVSIWPKPMQNPVPFWMPAGSLETIEFAAERHIVSAQVFFSPQFFKSCFDKYREVARTKYEWEAPPSAFVGTRFIHVAESNKQACEEGEAALDYMFKGAGLARPVNNPAPVPGLQTDRSFEFRGRDNEVFPAPGVPFEQLREKGWIVCGDPDYVEQWLRKEMELVKYGNFMGMFRPGNLAHEKVMKSKQLFAKYVMPKLRNVNPDPAGVGPVVPCLPREKVKA
ncbi:MAG: LLM class flavin-dependent oxidoreductase [Dehalococcoidia bacterium]|nr:LLM class flavin-dependent oxidoreductase [Dehalococcoidia bacterium]